MWRDEVLLNSDDIFVHFGGLVAAGELDWLRVIVCRHVRCWVDGVGLVVAVGVVIVKVVIAKVRAADVIVVEVGTANMFFLIDDRSWSRAHRV
jgi:hypothetical protein